MDNLLVGTLSLPKFPSENSLPSVMSSATSSLWKTFRDHRNHRSENRDQLITISPESVIIFPRNPDHDHPGIAITIARNRRSPSPGIPKKFARALEVPIYQLFYKGEEPPKLPKLPKRKGSSDIVWGSTGKEARLLVKFCQLCSRMDESDLKLLFSIAQKMARPKGE
jgi:hypothetical protein